MKSKSEKVVKALLERFPNLSINLQYAPLTRNAIGETAIFVAINLKQQSLFSILMDYKPNLSIQTNDKRDCLSAAQKSGQLEVVTSLMKAGVQLRPVSASGLARLRPPKPKVI